MNHTEINNSLSLLADSQSNGRKVKSELNSIKQAIKHAEELLRQALIREKADRFGASVGISVALFFILLLLLFRNQFQYAVLLLHRTAAAVSAFIAFIIASRAVKQVPYQRNAQGGFSETTQSQSIMAGSLAAGIILLLYWLVFEFLKPQIAGGGVLAYFIVVLTISFVTSTLIRKHILSKL